MDKSKKKKIFIRSGIVILLIIITVDILLIGYRPSFKTYATPELALRAYEKNDDLTIINIIEDKDFAQVHYYLEDEGLSNHFILHISLYPLISCGPADSIFPA